MLSFDLIIRNPNNPNECYVLSPKDENSIWIGRGDGEGGEFNAKSFFEFLDKFYKDNF